MALSDFCLSPSLLSPSPQFKPGVGKLFSRRARLGKLLKPWAARWLENKVQTLFFFGDHG